MKAKNAPFIAKVIGPIPYRLQLAGGWIDQQFVSRHNLRPPGSLVVVQLGPRGTLAGNSAAPGPHRAAARRL